MSEYRAPRGANPWRTAETALRETARTAFDEGHDSWGSRMLSGADCIAALESQLAEAERTIAELRALVSDLQEGNRNYHELLNRASDERDEARRVAVWSAKHCAEAGFDRDWPAVWYTVKSARMTRWGIPVTSLQYDGTDDDLYRALREAMGE